jgi:hypothetical protein
MIDNTWPEPYQTALVRNQPPFDYDRQFRLTVTKQWLSYVPNGIPSVQNVLRFANVLSTRIKPTSTRRYLASLRDVLTRLFPSVELAQVLPKQIERVFSTCPMESWPLAAIDDLTRAKKVLKPRVWQSSKEVMSKYLAISGVPWPPDPHSLHLFIEHIVQWRKDNTACSYLRFLHTLLASSRPKEDYAWMIGIYRHLGRREVQPRRNGQYRRRISGLPVNQWPNEWQHAWSAFTAPRNSTSVTTVDNKFIDGASLLRALESASGSKKPPEGAQCQAYATATLETWRYAAGQYFGVLKEGGYPLVLDRVSVGIWADAERPHIEPITFATRLGAILQVAQVLFPHQDWKWLVDLVHAGYSVAPGKGAWSPRHADRLVGAGRLRHAALAVLRSVKRKPPTLRTAVQFRDALIVLFLTHEPLRRKDLADLPLTAMKWENDGSVSIKFFTSKNDEKVNNIFIGDLAEYLFLWMNQYRTILTAGVEQKTSTLLVGQGGASLTAGNLTRLVRSWTSKHLGLALSPHDVRGAVAYTVVAHKGDVLAATGLLRNRDSRIVERHYSGVAGQVHAGQALDRRVEEITSNSSVTKRKICDIAPPDCTEW